MEEQLVCPVCMEIFLDPITIPCGHTFCKDCLFMALRNSEQCSLCRQPIPSHVIMQSPNIILKQLIQSRHSEELAARLRTRQKQERFVLFLQSPRDRVVLPYSRAFFQLEHREDIVGSGVEAVVGIDDTVGVYGGVSRIAGQFMFAGKTLVKLNRKQVISPTVTVISFQMLPVLPQQGLTLQSFHSLDHNLSHLLHTHPKRAQIIQKLHGKGATCILSTGDFEEKMWLYVEVLNIREEIRMALIRMTAGQRLQIIEKTVFQVGMHRLLCAGSQAGQYKQLIILVALLVACLLYNFS